MYEGAPAIALAALVFVRNTERVDAAALLAYVGVGVLLLVTFAAALWGDAGDTSPSHLLRIVHMSWPLISLTLVGSVTMLCAAMMLERPLRIWLIVGGILLVCLLVILKAFVFY